MLPKDCLDCGKPLRGRNNPQRCKSCAIRHRYFLKHGHPAPRMIANCDACGLEFSDYVSNRRKGSEHFCSPECRASWTGIKNSIRLGGDGIKRSKSEKDAIYYRAGHNANVVRLRANRHYTDNKQETLRRRRENDRQAKQAVVDAYGGQCVCCGESQIEFLTIDHINNDGALHRRRVGKGRRIYRDLIAQGFPKDNYRLLCFNCNITRGFYGYCPHKPEEKSYVSKVPLGVAGRRRSVA